MAMTRLAALAFLFVAAVGVCSPRPARADFSACDSAIHANDPQQKIEFYTICLKKGGLQASDAAGALNNRGVAYENVGQPEQALQDFVLATQYDPNWPQFRANRAFAEAQNGKCAEAQADIKLALKMAPHRKQFLELNDKIAARCPAESKPAG
jgi:tetratricopeptide (TPR) repeat protein